MILAIIKHYSNGNKAHFATKLGLTPQSISTWISRNTFDIDKIYANCEDISAEWLLTGKGDMIKIEPQTVMPIYKPKVAEFICNDDIPLYDVVAAANLQTLFCNREQNLLGKINIPNSPKCDGAVYVTGDSMYPLLKAGDIVAYKEIHDPQNIIYGEMYLISLNIEGDEYLSVKYINHSEMEGYVKLVSYNIHHQPKDVPYSAITALAIVKLSIRKNTML